MPCRVLAHHIRLALPTSRYADDWDAMYAAVQAGTKAEQSLMSTRWRRGAHRALKELEFSRGKPVRIHASAQESSGMRQRKWMRIRLRMHPDAYKSTSAHADGMGRVTSYEDYVRDASPQNGGGADGHPRVVCTEVNDW